MFGIKIENFNKIVVGHDILALTETQCDKNTNISISGYYVFKNSRPKHKKAKRHSGGIAVCITQELKSAARQIPSRSNDIIWIKLKHDELQLEQDIIVGTIYISPANSTYTHGQIETVWDVLEDELLQLKNNEYIFIAGDFNAHTGCLPDFITNDDDIHSPVPLFALMVTNFWIYVKHLDLEFLMVGNLETLLGN